MKFIFKILSTTVIIIFAAYLVPGVSINNFTSALLAAIAISFLNAVIKPILVLLTIPITFLTLGLFLLVINTIIILMADYLIDGFEVSGFWPALIFSILLSLTSSLFENLHRDKK